MTTTTLGKLRTLDDLARACGVEGEFIEEYSRSQRQADYYDVIRIPKRGARRRGEFRVVFKAKEHRLSSLHRSLAMIVANSASFGEHVQGFRKGYSTRTNAGRHLSARVLLHADIKGFFDAISTEQVRGAILARATSYELAATVARVCTIDGLLRQGTRCSPAVANLVCHDMDQAFLALAVSHGCEYTRYADDLTFSGDEVPSQESIRDTLNRYKFQLRDDRCYLQHRGKNQYVTGLTVADSERPRLPRRLKRQLRLTMHYIGKFGLDGHRSHSDAEDEFRDESWLAGMLSFANSIEPQLASKWIETFDAALEQRRISRSNRS